MERNNRGVESPRPLALVAGASVGIGLVIARLFARNGFASRSLSNRVLSERRSNRAVARDSTARTIPVSLPVSPCKVRPETPAPTPDSFARSRAREAGRIAARQCVPATSLPPPPRIGDAAIQVLWGAPPFTHSISRTTRNVQSTRFFGYPAGFSGQWKAAPFAVTTLRV
jgi:hypothetical protein